MFDDSIGFYSQLAIHHDKHLHLPPEPLWTPPSSSWTAMNTSIFLLDHYEHLHLPPWPLWTSPSSSWTAINTSVFLLAHYKPTANDNSIRKFENLQGAAPCFLYSTATIIKFVGHWAERVRMEISSTSSEEFVQSLHHWKLSPVAMFNLGISWARPGLSVLQQCPFIYLILLILLLAMLDQKVLRVICLLLYGCSPRCQHACSSITWRPALNDVQAG